MAKRVDYKLSEALALPIGSILLGCVIVYLLFAIVVAPEAGVIGVLLG